MLSELKGDLKNVGKSTSEDLELEDPPFIQVVLDLQIQPKSRLTTFNKYDGSTDLLDHTETYKSMMDFHAYSDAMKCRAFSITLQGSAIKWYRQLTLYSITT